MIDYDKYSEVTSVEEIVATVDVRLQVGRVFRLEVVRAPKGGANVDYGVRYFERRTLFKTTAGEIVSECEPDATELEMWERTIEHCHSAWGRRINRRR